VIEFKNVRKSYGESQVLNDVSFTVETGEFAVLIGPSGCGKTTTLKTINKLIDIEAGSIFIDGRDISEIDKVTLRRSIGYVIQQIGLFPTMTVEQNICVVPKLLKYDKQRMKEIARDMLALVNMPYEEYAHKYPAELSGGQQQRIGVMRALAASPPIVLMDEPFGALDPMTRSVLQEEIKRLQAKLNKTIVFVTHDMDEALNLADKIIFMNHGDVVQIGSPEELLANPADNIIRNFMGKRTLDSDVPEKASDFMIKNVYTTRKTRGIRESVDRMARRNIDSLIVTDLDNKYLGTVSIKQISDEGREHATIEPLVTDTNEWCYADEDAQKCFEQLLSGKDSYVVILNRDKTVAGIVTKSSMARALAGAVWGENQ